MQGLGVESHTGSCTFNGTFQQPESDLNRFEEQCGPESRVNHQEFKSLQNMSLSKYIICIFINIVMVYLQDQKKKSSRTQILFNFLNIVQLYGNYMFLILQPEYFNIPALDGLLPLVV